MSNQNRIKTLLASDFPDDVFLEAPRPTISVCFPALNEAATIVDVVTPAVALMRKHVIDEVVVAVAGEDNTAELAERAGARVVWQHNCHPELGEVAGKGDALWRVYPQLVGEVIVFCDADSGHFDEHFIRGLAGPLVTGVAEFVKGFYERPFKDASGTVSPAGGGRVTTLTALPLLRCLFPELAGFHQPLAGEMAFSRGLLDRLAFPLQYGVEISTLIQAAREVGVYNMAQTDLGVRQNRHQDLAQLGEMADQVAASVLAPFLGSELWGRLDHPPLPMRPARDREAPLLNVWQA